MANTCTVSGTIHDADGTPLTNTTIDLYYRGGVTGTSAGTIVPAQAVQVTSDGTGAISVDLVVGVYELRAQGAERLLKALVTVDQASIDAGTADLHDLLGVASDPAFATDAKAARDAAQAARDQSQDARDAAQAAEQGAQNAAATAQGHAADAALAEQGAQTALADAQEVAYGADPVFNNVRVTGEADIPAVTSTRAQLGQLASTLGQVVGRVDDVAAAQDGGQTLTALASVIGQLSQRVSGGQIELRGGTLDDPALRIGSVGIYSAAADTLSVAIAGVEVARFTAAGLTIYGTVTEA